MERNAGRRLLPVCVLGLFVCFAAVCVQCDATNTRHRYRGGNYFFRRFHFFKKFENYMPLDSSNSDPYVSSPFSLPPYDSLPPFPLPDNAPPYCVNPPSTPQPPSTIPSPVGGYPPSPPAPSPPETTPIPNPPIVIPTPPTTNVPTPTAPFLSPPYYEPSPPSNSPAPPRSIPSPTPRFLPPIVFPPPTVPPPPRREPPTAMWCVAKPAVPDPIIQEAMNYACGSGADCGQIQPSGSCFEPNTLLAHASYAFNSYWQRTKVTGGTCDFGGTALLVTIDPSYDGCHFIYF
ncbi:UNVERIFIED_CONTAM: Glucan endo-1,3-beta-glucosidase 4 [Sesamum latifolium]|uniref:Glucan endo-1,3-beta-glucosidase 4 n=2 Tax=Sesamum TaxID=4181 RepID=A0AAW2WP02_9LAMI